jgi:manganese transport protein
VLAVFGPAFIASVAYVDPGNFATNVSAGAKYGTLLVWVVVLSMVVQYLSAKLGIATGASLPELCRQRFRPGARIALWLQAELVVIMTDLAEFVGGAIALRLLFHLPLFAGGLVMVAVVFIILMLRVRGRDGFVPVVFALLFVVVLAFAYQAVTSSVGIGEVAAGLIPRLDGADSAYLAAGIVGATMMPQVIYLHSGLTQHMEEPRAKQVRRQVRSTRWDVMVALALAGAVNVIIVVSAVGLRGDAGDSLEAAHLAFVLQAGAATGLVFAVALLASSIASSCVGVYTGQMIMQGFLRRQVPIWVRRVASAVPPLVILGLGMDATGALVLSQVVLSFGIPFALIPLIMFTRNRELMGPSVNTRLTTAVAVAIASVIIGLNAFLLVSTFAGL